MPVAATSQEATLMVSFVEWESEYTQSEIVCLVRPYKDGMEILYSNHIQRTRATPKSPWAEKAKRIPLSPALIAHIETGVLHELWSKFCMRVIDAPPNLLPRNAKDVRGILDNERNQ